MSAAHRHGGKPVLHVALWGADVSAALNGQDPRSSIDRAIRARSSESVKADVTDLGSRRFADVGSTLADVEPDVLVVSPGHELAVTTADDVIAQLTAIVARAKSLGTWVLAVNASSAVPPGADDEAGRAQRREIQRMNLALMELSIGEGISVVDVDRLVAEVGGQRSVLGVLRYSDEALEGLCELAADVLADYGFFEHRPLVEQVGRARR